MTDFSKALVRRVCMSAVAGSIGLTGTAASALDYCGFLNQPEAFDFFTGVIGLTDTCDAPRQCAAHRLDVDTLGVLIYTGDGGAQWLDDVSRIADQFSASFSNATGIPVQVGYTDTLDGDSSFQAHILIALGDEAMLSDIEENGNLADRLRTSEHRLAAATQDFSSVRCASATNLSEEGGIERSVTLVPTFQNEASRALCVMHGLYAGTGYSDVPAGYDTLNDVFGWGWDDGRVSFPEDYEPFTAIYYSLPSRALASRSALEEYRDSECQSG